MRASRLRRLLKCHPILFNFAIVPILILALLVFLLALPLILPVTFVCNLLERRSLLAAARTAVCPSCGAILGAEAVQRADDEWRTHIAELHQNHPGVKFRLIRTVDAICGACGSMLSFQKATRTFTLASSPGIIPGAYRSHSADRA
jgi:hypothetical protein